MNKQQSKLFQNFFAVNLPLFEDLVKNVCAELGQADKTEAMLNKFLYQDKKKFTKILNKKNNNNKRRKTSYSMFLADKTVLAALKAQYPELGLSELNKKKGEYWRNTVKQSPEILAAYQAKADEANKKMNKPVETPVEKVEEIKEEIVDEPQAELVIDTNLEIPERQSDTPPPPPSTPISKKTKKSRKSRAKKSKAEKKNQ